MSSFIGLRKDHCYQGSSQPGGGARLGKLPGGASVRNARVSVAPVHFARVSVAPQNLEDFETFILNSCNFSFPCFPFPFFPFPSFVLPSRFLKSGPQWLRP